MTKGGLLKVFCDVISILIEIVARYGVGESESLSAGHDSSVRPPSYLQIRGAERRRKHESGGVYGGRYGAISFPVKEGKEKLIVVKRSYLEDKLKLRHNRNTVKDALYVLDGEVAGIKVFNTTESLIKYLVECTGMARSMLDDEIRRDFGYHPARHYIVIHPQEFLYKGIIQLMKEQTDLFTPRELSRILEERGILVGFKDLLVFCTVLIRLTR